MLAKRDERGRAYIAAFKLTRSPLKYIHSMNAASQFASTMATMLTAGLPLTKCLEVTANVIANDALSESTRRVRQGVEQGKSLADCMARDPYFPQMLTEMTGVGENSGNLEGTLNVVSDYFTNEVELTTNRLLSLLEPCITVALAVLTVILLLGVYLPMFSMYGSM